jgi:bifunctional UDP-N-acetylglucosamine pyrophosphorylase/glucosamine-1-phosphate N-acetyltransferase
MDDPSGYGRIFRDASGDIQKIVEERDASDGEREINEINAGIYCFDGSFLFEALDSISSANAQNEYYLTDTVSIAREGGLKVGSLTVKNSLEVMVVNNRIELARANTEKRREILESLMLAGVTIIDPSATYIDLDVRVGRDTVIYPHTIIQGSSAIGKSCIIGAGCQIVDSTLGDGVTVKLSSVIQESVIRDQASIGPFAHLRPGSDIGEEAKIGNFVEVKKSSIGRGSKASHLTYLGDTALGTGVNVGAGTITCNYDGFDKHPTTIEDDVFIGSNTALVAPVKVGKGAIIGAGSTITKKVPADSLAVERSKQVTYNNMAALLRKKKGKK